MNKMVTRYGTHLKKTKYVVLFIKVGDSDLVVLVVT